MDRLSRPFVALGMGLLMASSGCRATRTEVPPGRPFAKDGQQRPAIEFSSGGHPVNGGSSASFSPAANLGGSNMASGIGSNGARPDGAAWGGPPGAYGPPGTAGMPSSSDPATSRASMPPAEMPPLDSPPPNSSPVPDLNVTLSRVPRPEAPNPVIQPPVDKPGTMGTPDQMPSPN